MIIGVFVNEIVMVLSYIELSLVFLLGLDMVLGILEEVLVFVESCDEFMMVVLDLLWDVIWRMYFMFLDMFFYSEVEFIVSCLGVLDICY